MLKIRELSAELQKVAIEELGEDPQRIAADVQALKTWIEQQPHLKARTNDQFLIAFLRGCKYSLEKTKTKLDTFYTLRTKFPELFVPSFDNPKHKELIKTGLVLPCPTPLNETGPRLILVRLGIYNPDEFNFMDFTLLSNLYYQISLFEDDIPCISGLVNIIDCSGLTAKHLMQITPTIMKRMSVYTEEALPQRVKGLHFINAPAAFHTILNVGKSFMSAKQANRVSLI